MRIRSTVLAAVAGTLAMASPAQAAQVPLGDTGVDRSPGLVACPGGMYFQDTSAGRSYVAPSKGVLTSWSIAGLSSNNPTVRLKIASADGTRIVAQSAAQVPTSGVNTFAIRMPVSSLQRIGLGQTQTTTGNICAPRTGANADLMRSSSTDAGPGGAFDLPFSATKRRVNVSATWEGDRDNDGFGDDTQDACPEDPDRQQTPCAGDPEPPVVPNPPVAPDPPAPGEPKDPETPEQPGSPEQPRPRPANPQRPGAPAVAPQDNLAPSLRARAARRQRVARSRRLRVRVSSSEAAALTATARVNVRGVRLRRVSVDAAAGRTVVLRVRASKRASRRLRAALARKRRVTATVRITARDAAGNESTRRIRVRIVG